MATKGQSAKSSRETRPVLAPILDGAGLPLPEQAPLTHPDPALLHLVPRTRSQRKTLARVENLLGKGHFGAALREAQPPIELADPALAGRYEFIRQEKLSRAQIGIADRYFLRGDRESARQFYERALLPATNDAGVKEVAELAGKVFDDLTSSRRELISALRADAQAGNFTEWCGRKKTLTDGTILDVGPVRERIYPDFRLEAVFGERPPITVEPGYLDPLAGRDRARGVHLGRPRHHLPGRYGGSGRHRPAAAGGAGGSAGRPVPRLAGVPGGRQRVHRRSSACSRSTRA